MAPYAPGWTQAYRTLSWGVMLAVLLAGCTDGKPIQPASAETSAPPVVTESTGAIDGTVTDDELVPLDAVQVGLGRGSNQSTKTDPLGRFKFDEVEPGDYQLYVQKLGYESRGVAVKVAAGEVSKVEIRLKAQLLEPGKPLSVSLFGIRSQGGWFQIPYQEAAAALPPGFEPKPHVLLDPNDQTAEFSLYVLRYRNGTVAGEPVPEGTWSFGVLSVNTPSQHSSGATVDFFIFVHYATDPKLRAALEEWNLGPVREGQVTLTSTAAGPDSYQVTGHVQGGGLTYDLTTVTSQRQDSLTGGALTVRFFGAKDKVVTNYVDSSLTSVLYSITGAADVRVTGRLPFTLLANEGEGYYQWGDTTLWKLEYVPAKAAKP